MDDLGLVEPVDRFGECVVVAVANALSQYLVSLTKLAVLMLQSLHLLGHIARQACSFAAIDLGILHPLMQRGWRAADLGRDRGNGRSPR
jgi:hypothetical protein